MLVRYPSTSSRIVRDYVISIAFWLTISVFAAFQQNAMAVKEHIHITLRELLLLYAVRYMSAALLTPPIFYLVERWPINTISPPWRVLGYLGGFVPFSIAFGFIRWCLLPPWEESTQSFAPRSLDNLLALMYFTFADVLLMYMGVVVAAHAYAYFYRNQLQEIERLELRQALAQSELEALKIQLHPHFLFNTLHGISTLIDTDSVIAKSMLVKLSTLLRIALKHGSSDLVPFREEIGFLESYLELEKMRLGKRLEVRWLIDRETRDALVPQLILQPLAENAIVHGIACCREGGWIEIHSRKIGNNVRIQIRNSIGCVSSRGMGVGITNTKARLKYLYSDESSFNLRIRSGETATATLVLPALSGTLPEFERQMVTIGH
jgi:two-component system LytT family sensor kinase